MTAVFADTSFYVAVVNSRDAFHEAARRWSDAYSGRVVTTEFVLVEVANFHSLGVGRVAFSDLLKDLKASPDLQVVPASTELFHSGAALFAARSDKDWSLTDCTSFVVMQDMGLTEALTADHHFEQAGFRALLKPA
jgi:predicted nucleic acid-binding protein